MWSYKLYPPDFPKRSRFIRFYRARNHCEGCSAPNYNLILRDRSGKWFTLDQVDQVDNLQLSFLDLPPVQKRIVLATAHLDQNEKNGNFFNLISYCQYCHLSHDRLDNLRRRKVNEQQAKANDLKEAGQMVLFSQVWMGEQGSEI